MRKEGEQGRGVGGQCSSPSKMADTFDVSKRLLIDICQTEVCFFFCFFFRGTLFRWAAAARAAYGWMDGCGCVISLSLSFVRPSLHRVV